MTYTGNEHLHNCLIMLYLTSLLRYYTLLLLPLLFLLASCRPEQAAPAVLTTPDDWMYRQRAYPHGRIDQDVYLRAMQQWQALAEHPGRSGAAWVSVGPDNIGGRITSLAVPPGQQELIYVGAASGGVFKTTNGGQNWRPIFDNALSLAIGDLAVAPSSPEVLYVGTGEANAGGGSLAYDGVGVYKSEDGGLHWQHLGLARTGSTGKIIVHPQRPEQVYVATMGNLFANNRQRGLYRSRNGGQNWQQILFINDSTGVIDLAMPLSHPNVLYAASWERIRRPHRRQYTGPGSGIYRSFDGGDNWERLTLPISPAVPLGRIALAVAPTRPQRVYASVVGESGDLLGVYHSDNHGDNWQSLPIQGIDQVPFMWWFGKLYVHPDQVGTVFLCGLRLHRLRLGNPTWETLTRSVHVDQHALYLDPQDPTFALLGNDGGLYKASDAEMLEATHFTNLPITQFYTAEIDVNEPERLFGGSQDNGSLRRFAGTNRWTKILGGDGLVNLVDPNDSRFVYAAFQYGNLYRSENGGDHFRNGLNGIAPTELKNWHTPVILDPVTPSTLYYGAQRVYRSTNRAQSWEAISPMLIEPPAGSNLVFGTLTSLAVSAVDPQVIYAGGDDGTLARTLNGGQSWQYIHDDLPQRWITSLATHPTEAGVAYITLSGYRWEEYQPHVLRTDDFGSSWTATDAGLPEVPVNDLVIDPERPDRLFLATDAGVFLSEDAGLSWYLFGEDMPKVVVTDLDYHAPTRTLVAATYGRSMYRIQLDDPVAAAEAPDLLTYLRAYPNPFTESVSLQLHLTESTDILLEVYDLSGRQVTVLHRGRLGAGEHHFNFKPPTRADYICQLRSNQETSTLLLLAR